MLYVCKTKCFWDGRLFEVGDTVEKSTVTPPSHFIPVEPEETAEEKPVKPPVKQKAEPEPVKPKRGRMAKAKEKDRG